MTITADASRGFITDPTDRALLVIDFATDTRIATVPIPGTPIQVAINNSGAQVYVGTASTLQVVDTCLKLFVVAK